MFHRAHLDLDSALRVVPAFRGLDAVQAEAIRRETTHIGVTAGTVLGRERHLLREFVIVLEGLVRIEREGHAATVLEPGEFYGEVSMIDGGPATATAIAETDCELLVVDGHSFPALLDEVPAFRRQVMARLCDRLRSEPARGPSVEARLAV